MQTLRTVEALMADGAPRAEMQRATQLPLRTLDAYARRVRERWHDLAVRDSQDARGRALTRLLDLREKLVTARAWPSLVALERLLIDVEGVREPPGAGGPHVSPDMPTYVPQVTPAWIGERAALLVGACARLAHDSDDDGLRNRTRIALEQGLALLDPGPSRGEDAG